MSIQKLLQTMRRRIPWEVAQKILSELDLPGGLGWERALSKIEALTDLSETDEVEIADVLKQHVICGEKLVRFYRLPEEVINILRARFTSADLEDTPAADAYPSMVDEDDFGTLSGSPRLVAVETYDHGVAAIFTSVRTLELRESLEIDALPTQAAEALSSYDDIVGIKLMRWQAFDVIWLPHQGTLADIRIDFPRGMRQESAEIACRLLVAAIKRVTGDDLLGEPVNLFPLIDRIYQDAAEGRVVELSFGTTTASLKHEKMRRRHLNLRAETYHMAGKAGLATAIEPFRLAVEWDRRVGSDVVARPEALFNGSARLSMSAAPTLPEVVIRKSRGLSDFNLVRSRIEAHLGSV